MNAWSDGAPSADKLSSLLPQQPAEPRAALADLVETHGDRLFGLCMRMVRDTALAEEILQQALLEALRDARKFRGQSSLLTWVTGIAIHRCQDALQARRRRDQRFEPGDAATLDPADLTPSPTERIAQVQLVHALEDCLASLSEAVRTAVLLRFQSGMSYEEMSRLLGIKADTLQTRVARALPMLRRCLEGKGWTP